MNAITRICDRFECDRRERMGIWASITAWICVWCIGMLVLFGPRLIWSAEETAIVLQILIGLLMFPFSYALLAWSLLHTVRMNRKRLGKVYNFNFEEKQRIKEAVDGYDDLNAQIESLKVQVEHLTEQLDLAYEQISDTETLIRAHLDE